MKVAFAGSHEISWHCLRAIAQLAQRTGDEISAVYNVLPDAGARHSAFIEFDGLAGEFGFPSYKIRSLSDEATLAQLRSLKLDVLFVIGWHRIVPQSVIDVAGYCLGLHSSLLPKHRGSSPVNWEIIRGDHVGGMSLFHLTPEVDAGDLVGQRSFEIADTDTCDDVHSRATAAAIDLLRENWDDMRAGRLSRTPQDLEAGWVNPRRRPEDGRVDWAWPAKRVYDWIRALTHPYPGAFTQWRDRRLFLWQAVHRDEASGAEPGTVIALDDRIHVATGSGVVELLALQAEGDPECHARVFRRVYDLQPGDRLG